MKTIVYNIVVAVGYFLGWLLMDYRYVKTHQHIYTADLLTNIGEWAMFTLPLAFFLANKGLFPKLRFVPRYGLITLIAVGWSAIWMFFFIFVGISIHLRMGGSL